MNDDRMITLLRETPLPADDPARYEAVVARGRRQDRRRTTIAAASLAVVAIAGTVTALTWRGRSGADPQSFLTSQVGTARMTLTLHQGSYRVTGKGVVDFSHHAYELTYNVGGSTETTRGIGSDTWTEGLGAFGVQPGKHWVHFTSSDQQPSGFGAINPSDILRQLRADHATITRVGRTAIDGVPVTDYRVVSPVHRTGIDLNAQEVGGRPTRTTETGHVYIDEDGVMRRLTSNDGIFQLDFTDFGTPVDIQPPDKGDVTDFDKDSLLGPAGSHGNGATIQITPGPIDAKSKARACQLVTQALTAQPSIPKSKRDELLKDFCGH